MGPPHHERRYQAEYDTVHHESDDGRPIEDACRYDAGGGKDRILAEDAGKRCDERCAPGVNEFYERARWIRAQQFEQESEADQPFDDSADDVE